MAEPDRQKQMEEAEELLEGRLDEVGFAKGLYFGKLLDDSLPPYPDLIGDESGNRAVADLEKFCNAQIDPDAIDRDAEIPPHVVAGLGELGVLGACLPKDAGGLEMNQTTYCRLIEVLGGRCASTALFVNAHHSIGPRGIVLFGTDQQRRKWLPRLATGEWISAFALTEPEAGSDASNVQTTALPSDDGSAYVLNGEKRWITNGGIARVLTVMAKTPVPGEDDDKITAFLVTPDMPGFEVVEARMEKCGVRGTVTSRLAFHDMVVPRENVLGEVGKGLRVALTVLDFGRTTFGASCTGAAKFCLEHALRHASTRVQFDQTLGQFELVKKKLAYMAAGVYAMEAVTYQTAALIDAGEGEYMIETAMLKIFATEVLWRIIQDTIQIHGGKAYFCDEPFERMMRDARINTIGEGANDVLRAFVALVGMRDVGLELKGVLEALLRPWGNLGKLSGFASRKISSMLSSPSVPCQCDELKADAARLGKLLGTFGKHVEKLLRKHQEAIVDRQYQLERVADSATEIYASICVLRRLDRELRGEHYGESERQRALASGQYYLRASARRIEYNFQRMWSNDDDDTTQLADQLLDGESP